MPSVKTQVARSVQKLQPTMDTNFIRQLQRKQVKSKSRMKLQNIPQLRST
jgi:hypothetical protein